MGSREFVIPQPYLSPIVNKRNRGRAKNVISLSNDPFALLFAKNVLYNHSYEIMVILYYVKFTQVNLYQHRILTKNAFTFHKV